MEPEQSLKPIAYGIVPAAEARTLSGLELLRKILEGELPAPPISKVMHFRMAELEAGRVVFSGQPDADCYNPQGTVHGGYASTLLDSCMGCAIHSMLPAGSSYTTLEIKVNFIRPLRQDTGPVRAEGKVISVGKRVGTAEGRIFDSQNRLYAHATTTCLIFPL